MRASEFVTEMTLNEITLANISNWFQKYAQSRAINAGEKEVRNYTNGVMMNFARFIGRYKLDWRNVTLYVMYTFLRLQMKLSDSYILRIVNSIMKDIGANALTIEQIKDKNNDTLIANLKKVGNIPSQYAQIISEKIIAAAVLQKLELEWHSQANVAKDDEDDSTQDQKVTAQAPKSKEPIVVNGEKIMPEDERYAPIAAALAKQGIAEDYENLKETATGGATASGSVASIANPMGGVISRTPNLFGYIPASEPDTQKKRKNKRKNAR